MFKNNFPPPKKSPQMLKPNATMITMTAYDATMNVISLIHDFPSQKPFYTPFTRTKIIQIRDLDSYLDREILSCVNTTSGSRI